ncbi:MAG: hypothetical protein OXQ29_09105 [Rhodospirillaceae bacterium]|nr:hypothetical protein [Rhodospirillaceae bacterium]
MHPKTLGTIGLAHLVEAVCAAASDEFQNIEQIRGKVFSADQETDVDFGLQEIVRYALRVAVHDGRLLPNATSDGRVWQWRLPTTGFSG